MRLGMLKAARRGHTRRAAQGETNAQGFKEGVWVGLGDERATPAGDWQGGMRGLYQSRPDRPCAIGSPIVPRAYEIATSQERHTLLPTTSPALHAAVP